MEHKHHARGEGQKEFFDKLAGEWDTITFHEEKKVRYITSLLKLNGGEDILDVGTGTGVMVPFYEEYLKTGSIIAIDFSENMISQCMKKFPRAEHPNVAFEVADVYDLKSEEEFDVVMCYSCFPHFADHQRAIDIFACSLRQGGKFAIAHSSSRDHINHVHSDSSHHIQKDLLPSLTELDSMFNNADLHVSFERSDSEYHIIIGEKQ
jgi:demethylmenaquinone methyltransferase/2-methoxy-6-polyprenyl-1,4-benzoquinol methylase